MIFNSFKNAESGEHLFRGTAAIDVKATICIDASVC